MHKNVHKNRNLEFVCDVYQPRRANGTFGKATVIRNKVVSTVFNVFSPVVSKGEIIHWSKEDKVFQPKSLANKLLMGVR
jgi:hypothetical protein